VNARHEFKTAGLSPHIIHCSNSAAIARFPLEQTTHVRPGIALYGCNPDPGQDFTYDLRPVASLKARVVKIKRVPSGTPVSYGGQYVTSRETHIATIPIGYAHGLPRMLGSRGGCVLIGGKRYGIAGRVTMDYVMVDAGAEPEFGVGDEAVAMGCQGSECIGADEIARRCGTIGYEILCGLNRRIDRYYTRCGRVVFHGPAIQY
jgi:alanine racemase